MPRLTRSATRKEVAVEMMEIGEIEESSFLGVPGFRAPGVESETPTADELYSDLDYAWQQTIELESDAGSDKSIKIKSDDEDDAAFKRAVDEDDRNAALKVQAETGLEGIKAESDNDVANVEVDNSFAAGFDEENEVIKMEETTDGSVYSDDGFEPDANKSQSEGENESEEDLSAAPLAVEKGKKGKGKGKAKGKQPKKTVKQPKKIAKQTRESRKPKEPAWVKKIIVPVPSENPDLQDGNPKAKLFVHCASLILDSIYEYAEKNLPLIKQGKLIDDDWSECAIAQEIMANILGISLTDLKRQVLCGFPIQVKSILGNNSWQNIISELEALSDNCHDIHSPGVYLGICISNNGQINGYGGSTSTTIANRVLQHEHIINQGRTDTYRMYLYAVAVDAEVFFRPMAWYDRETTSSTIIILAETLLIVYLGLHTRHGKKFGPASRDFGLNLRLGANITTKIPKQGSHCNRVLPIKQRPSGFSDNSNAVCFNCGDSNTLRQQYNRAKVVWCFDPEKKKVCNNCRTWERNNGRKRPKWIWHYYLRQDLGDPKCHNCGDTEPNDISIITERAYVENPNFDEMFKCRDCVEYFHRFTKKRVRPERLWKKHCRRKFKCHLCNQVEDTSKPEVEFRFRNSGEIICTNCQPKSFGKLRLSASDMRKAKKAMDDDHDGFHSWEKAAEVPAPSNDPWELLRPRGERKDPGKAKRHANRRQNESEPQAGTSRRKSKKRQRSIGSEPSSPGPRRSSRRLAEKKANHEEIADS